MDSSLAREIIACLPQERTLFHYFKDRYAFYLLGRHCQQVEQAVVGELKKGAARGLLQKPAVQNFLASNGGKNLCGRQVQGYWPAEQGVAVETYRLSLGTWGDSGKHSYRSQQTTRKGVNLVLHLNFNSRHDSEFENWTGVSQPQAFNYWGHPVSERCKNTLAWARMDVDFDSNTVLIEEIQTDWIRRVDRATAFINRKKSSNELIEIYGMQVRGNGVLSYQQHVLEVHRKVWAEAMMTASLWFIHEELGLKHVFYHTAETGAALKNIAFAKPPVSMYRELPRKFGFESTEDGPNFVYSDTRARRRLKRLKRPTWNRLNV